MTIIFGTLKDVGGQLAQGTVVVSSLVTRPAHGAASTVITKERHVLPLRNGAFESPELDPGPVLVEATTGGAFESWQVMLPEGGRHDLATLIETHVEYTPAVVGRVEAAAADANRAAQAAGQSATRAGEAERRVIVVESRISQVVADGAGAVRTELQSEIAGVDQARVDARAAQAAAEGHATEAGESARQSQASADAAVDAAGRAEVAADAADASAAAAGVSAGEAAASATAAQGHAEDAAGDATTASGARDAAVSAADSAQGSATAAAADAGRAESAADGVDQVVSDAAGALAGEIADDVAAAQSARTGAESARDQAVGAASQATTKADEAAADAAEVGEAREFVAGVHESLSPGGATTVIMETLANNAMSAASQAGDARDAAQGHADRAATEAGAAAQIAAQEKIAELIGDAPSNLDTIYELATAFADRGDAIAAIQAALANRVMGNHSSVIASTAPGPGTPSNQVTFVVEGT